jgi:hypothetical protein
LGNEKNKKRSWQWLRLEAMTFFGEKEIPKHILAFLLLSLPIVITTATFTIIIIADHRD